MARPNKYNLEYFPLNVGFFDDHKIVSVEEACGIKGGYIALRLMSMAYQDGGYYLEWPDGFEFTAAKRVGNGVTGASVEEVLKLCFKVGLFDKGMFERHRVITSAGIQKVWLKVMHDMRRKVKIRDELMLVSGSFFGVSSALTPVSSALTPVSSALTRVSSAFSTQKEMKGKERKELKEKVFPKPDEPEPMLWTEVLTRIRADFRWKEKFCRDKDLRSAEFDKWLDDFLTERDLGEDYKPIQELKSHFLHWFNKHRSRKQKAGEAEFRAVPLTKIS